MEYLPKCRFQEGRLVSRRRSTITRGFVHGIHNLSYFVVFISEFWWEYNVMMIGTKKVRQQMDRNCQSRAWQVVLHVGKIIKISLPFSYLWVIYQNTPPQACIYLSIKYYFLLLFQYCCFPFCFLSLSQKAKSRETERQRNGKRRYRKTTQNLHWSKPKKKATIFTDKLIEG